MEPTTENTKDSQPRRKRRRWRRYVLAILAVVIVAGAAFYATYPQKSDAQAIADPFSAVAFGIQYCEINPACINILRCSAADCGLTVAAVFILHEAYELLTMAAISGGEFLNDFPLIGNLNPEYLPFGFTFHRTWLNDFFFKQNILPAMQLLTEQLTNTAMLQMFAIGTFMDAKQQLETQRLLQYMQGQAHRDYHPSRDFCWFGTNVRSLASSEQMTEHNLLALNAYTKGRELGTSGFGSANTPQEDKLARWDSFTRKYCDPKDNNWQSPALGAEDNTGLALVCKNTVWFSEKRINNDIDYTRMVEYPHTIAANFSDDTYTTQEDDILALTSNLFAHNVPVRELRDDALMVQENQELYMDLRSVSAKRSVAQNSINSIIAMKSEGTSDANLTGEEDSKTWKFLGALLKELGVPDDEIFEMIGERPSYYAQLEILAKKIYQNPDFYAYLYESPANVSRKKVALRAIERILDHAIFESQLRQEMALSVLLSTKLEAKTKPLNDQIEALGGG